MSSSGENREMQPTEPSTTAATSSVKTTMSSAASVKTSKLRSVVWQHFVRYEDPIEGLMAKCKYEGCNAVYKANTATCGTNSMKKHIPKCLKNPNNLENDKGNQTKLSFKPDKEVKGSLSTWKFDQGGIRDALAKMIVIDELPFKFVEGEGFRKFMASACPWFSIPSRITISRDCVALYNKEFESLKLFFERKCQRISLTTDTWTSIQKINYMCLTAHCIDDDWKLQKRIINFCPISSHKGEAISLEIENCLRRWELEEKVFTITMDNSSSNDTSMSSFKRKMKNKKSSIKNGDFIHVRCVAHILNLVVMDGLKEKNEAIDRVKEAVRYVRQSPARLAKFKEYTLMEKIECTKSLCLDVPTRWNSTYFMLDVACKYERAFDRFDELEPSFKRDMEKTKMVKLLDDKNRVIYGNDGKAIKVAKTFDWRPTSDDWTICKKFANLLEHFYDVTVKILGIWYVTSNMVLQDIYEICALLSEWEVSNDIDLIDMGTKMRGKFDKYWGDPEKMNPLMYMSMVLDPRCKLDFVIYTLKKMFGEEIGSRAGMKIKITLLDMFFEYKALKEPQVVGSTNDQGSSENTLNDDTRSEKEKRKQALINEFKKQKTSNQGFGGRISEVDKYLMEDTEPFDGNDFDILDWWKQNSNSHRFPILSLVARDVLAIPMSTVASESAFSSGGRLLDPFRSPLTPKVVENLICAQDWLRASWKYNNVEEDPDEVEQLEAAISKLSVSSSLSSSSTQMPMEF